MSSTPMDHRKALEHALEYTDTNTANARAQVIVAMRMGGQNALADALEEGVLISRGYLASVRRAWPGEIPPEARRESGKWGASVPCLAGWEGHTAPYAWVERANLFERTYGIPVDDPWLVELMGRVGE